MTGSVNVFITVNRYPGAPSILPNPCQAQITENIPVGAPLPFTFSSSDSKTAVSTTLQRLAVVLLGLQ